MTDNLPAQYEASLVDPGLFQQALQLAEAMCKAKSLPAHLRDSPADCLRVVEIAFRTRQSPYAIADKTYFVGGKIAFEGQLCAALINAHPIIEDRLDYVYEGDVAKPQSLSCTISAKLRGEKQRREVKVTWQQGFDQSKGARDKWQSQPEQQLAYFGARVWGRRHAPEILMGIYTPEELASEPPIKDVTPTEPRRSDNWTHPSVAAQDAPGQATAPVPVSNSLEASPSAGGAWRPVAEALAAAIEAATTIDELTAVDTDSRDRMAKLPAKAQERLRDRISVRARELIKNAFQDSVDELEPEEWKEGEQERLV